MYVRSAGRGKQGSAHNGTDRTSMGAYGKQMDHAHQQLNSALPVHCRVICNARTLVTYSNLYYIVLYKPINLSQRLLKFSMQVANSFL